MTFTNAEKRDCIERELKMRRRVYPRWVELSLMSQDMADRQIALMEAILVDYAERARLNMSKRDGAESALRLALPVLRDLLRSDVECCAVLKDGEPRLESLDADDLAFLKPTLDAIQAAEKVIECPSDELPEWLNRIIILGLPEVDDG